VQAGHVLNQMDRRTGAAFGIRASASDPDQMNYPTPMESRRRHGSVEGVAGPLRAALPHQRYAAVLVGSSCESNTARVDARRRIGQLLEVQFGHEEAVLEAAGADRAPIGAWAARDHIGHFGLWRTLFLTHLQALVAGGTPPDVPPDDLDAVNDRQIALDREVSLEDLGSRWRTSWDGLRSWLTAASPADLARAPRWYAATSVAGALVRNSFTHPCGHLVDYYFERGQLDQAADLADEMAATVTELSELDFRFPAGAHVFAGVALALRGRPDEAMDALGRGVAMRPVNGPGLRDEITLASLRGRRDFEALTAPIEQ